MLAVIIILLVIALGLLIGLMVYLGRWCKANKENKADYRTPIKNSIIISIIGTVCAVVMSILIFSYCKTLDPVGERYIIIERDWSNIAWYSYVAAIGGSLFLSASIFVFFGAFILYYYGRFKPPKLEKWLYRTLIISVVCILIFTFVTLEGYAPYMAYPLISGISFSSGFYRANSGESGIAFYAIFILIGAIMVYLICDHRIYKQFGSHGRIDGTFIVGLVMGIIGARLFYVFGEWDYYSVHPGEIVQIWNGGLTVLGGVILGIICGGLWCWWRNHKKFNVLQLFDIIIPTILVAQVFGRWGNFFNVEVYGNAVDATAFGWLPTIIVNNMRTMRDTSLMYVPLFFIEGVVNVVGYYLITRLFGGTLRKYLENGDQACMYLVWYGLIRAIMEPLRDSNFNMGSNLYWSLIWSLCFMGAGLLLIAGNHIIRICYREKKGTQNYTIHTYRKSWITTLVLSIISVGLIVAGSVMMATSGGSESLEANTYTFGIISLISGISIFFIDVVAILNFIFSYKDREVITSVARYDLCIFDVDGTLANTDEMVRNSYIHLYDLHKNGIRPTDSDLYAFSGPQLRDVLKLEFPQDDTEKLAQEFYEYSSTQYDDVLAYDHTKEILEYLHKKGVKIGVYTNKRHDLTIKCLVQVNILEDIDFIVGYEDTEERKPSGEGISKIMTDSGISDKRRVLYIGDSPVDYKVATNAGVDFCHCHWGPREYKDENLAQPHSISNFNQLKDII